MYEGMYEGSTDIRTIFMVFVAALFFSLLATYGQWLFVDLNTIY